MKWAFPPCLWDSSIPPTRCADGWATCACASALPVEHIDASGFVVAGEQMRTADYYICALPFERLEAVGLPAPKLEHSPITGVHLSFDREVTTLPHATLLDRTMQWMFDKDAGRYLQLVVSASRDLTTLSRGEIMDLAIGDLRLYFPRVHDAPIGEGPRHQRTAGHLFRRARNRAFAARTPCGIPNVYLAGYRTRTGWPATMEGAVRSGYIAAEWVAQAAKKSSTYLIPDGKR